MKMRANFNSRAQENIQFQAGKYTIQAGKYIFYAAKCTILRVNIYNFNRQNIKKSHSKVQQTLDKTHEPAKQLNTNINCLPNRAAAKMKVKITNQEWDQEFRKGENCRNFNFARRITFGKRNWP